MSGSTAVKPRVRLWRGGWVHIPLDGNYVTGHGHFTSLDRPNESGERMPGPIREAIREIFDLGDVTEFSLTLKGAEPGNLAIKTSRSVRQLMLFIREAHEILRVKGFVLDPPLVV